MKRTIIYVLVIVTFVFTACNGFGSGPVYESKESMAKLIKQLKDGFGEKPAFSEIILAYIPQVGNTVSVQGNGNIQSNKLYEKDLTNGIWQTKSEITLEIEQDKTEDLLFTLDEIDLLKLPDLVADAKKRVSSEKSIPQVVATFAMISMPNKVEEKKADLNYTITVEPASGGTHFLLNYDLTGKFLTMTY